MTDRVERYRALFNAYYGSLCRYATRRIDDPDNLVAEVLATAWRRLDEIPVGRELPWLYGVAQRTLANQQRARARRGRLTARIAALRWPTEPPGTADDGDVGNRIVIALGRLRPDDQEILRLAAWEHLAAREIALVLGCSAEVAATRLSRARRRLRALLTEPATSRTQSSQEAAGG